MNHVIEVQFEQFAALVDQLGGLRIRFPTPARDRFTGLDQPAGCNTLTGTEALAFVRARNYEWLDGVWKLDPTGDLGRMARQQADDALRFVDAMRGGHAGSTLTLPTRRSLQGDQEGLVLAPAADTVLEALDTGSELHGLQATAPTTTVSIGDQPTAC